jgi:hypothetical protein
LGVETEEGMNNNRFAQFTDFGELNMLRRALLIYAAVHEVPNLESIVSDMKDRIDELFFEGANDTE